MGTRSLPICVNEKRRRGEKWRKSKRAGALPLDGRREEEGGEEERRRGGEGRGGVNVERRLLGEDILKK